MTKKEAVEKWWHDNPMTYGDEHGVPAYNAVKTQLGSLDFFNNVDKEFLSWNKPLHKSKAFDLLFPYEKYRGCKILEIGCGMGTMAMHWANNESSITAVDLNAKSIEQAKKRFQIFNLEGNFHQMDARCLEFNDAQFDYVYSWGVLHHSSDLARSLSELIRVLKPGGEFGIMLYARYSLLHWYKTLYVEGFLHMEGKFLNNLELASRYGDGAREFGNPHTWPVTESEIFGMLGDKSSNLKFKRLGTDLDRALVSMIPLLGSKVPTFIKKSWARRYGWSMWIMGTKK